MKKEEATEDEFTCDICGKTFDDISELDHHKRIHIRPIEREESAIREIRGDIGSAGLPTSPVR